jgi:hypothetical protein
VLHPREFSPGPGLHTEFTRRQNSKTGAFLSKSAAFSIIEEDDNGTETKLGTVTIDLASYATTDKSNDQVELNFMDGKVRLQLTLSSHWLRHMQAGVDDDDASVSSAGSFADSALGGGSDDDVDPSQWPKSTSRGEAAEGEPSHAASSRQMADAARNLAIEKRWDQEAGLERGMQEVESLKAEVADARAKLAQAHKEIKSLKGRVDQLASENRVLRRDQRGGKRDEVILQLETELVSKDVERAEMEENLAKAFGGALDEAHARIASLTAERDRLLIHDEAAAKRGGFQLRK